MSTTGKVILGIVIAVVVIGGGIWWWMASQPSSSQANMANNSAVTSTVTTTSTTTPSGDSDQAIEQEMTSANAQMNGFSSDSASMDQGLNDQPVQQGQ